MAQEVDVRIPVADNAGVQLVAKVASRGSSLAFIVTHPYGTLGGSLHDHVVRVSRGLLSNISTDWHSSLSSTLA